MGIFEKFWFSNFSQKNWLQCQYSIITLLWKTTEHCCSCSAVLKNSVLLKTCYDNKLLVLVYSANKSLSE